MAELNITKKKLSILLSQLKEFEKSDTRLEQYPTDPEIAAESLWFAMMQGDVKGKIIADLGSGTGILGLGALMLGARKACLIDIDSEAIELGVTNQKLLEEKTGMQLKASFSAGDINVFSQETDTVIMNPPFGTKQKSKDAQFLLKSTTIAPVIYTFHKASTKKYIDKLIKENGYKTTHYKEYDFPLKQTMLQHKKRIKRIRVGMWRIEKNS